MLVHGGDANKKSWKLRRQALPYVMNVAQGKSTVGESKMAHRHVLETPQSTPAAPLGYLRRRKSESAASCRCKAGPRNCPLRL